ncbi:MAG: hypothetical protein JWP30_620 [Homoserinimonas sp.]|jgi:hypothetical protein|nr:hypothetical protein [Homoserinimonas sp.]
MTEPSRSDRFKPAELLGFSAAIASFTGLVVLLATRDMVLAIIFFGVAFICTLVTIALLILAMKPDEEEKTDLDEQNRGH